MDEIEQFITKIDEMHVLSIEHSNTIYGILERLSKDNEEDILREIYLYVKGITNLYYYENCYEESLYSSYNLVRFSVSLAEERVLSRIINVSILFDSSDTVNKEKSFLDFLVYNTRKYLLEKKYLNDRIVKFEEINFANECQNAATYIKRICDENGFESYILCIAPGYDKTARLYGDDGFGFHYFNVVKYNGEYYLVDVTYSQFFYTNHNLLDRIGLVNIPPCDPGCFMLMTSNGFDIAAKIIERGYIKLDEQVFKAYLDAFTVSFRNGLYYECTDDFSFTTDYTIDDYVKFLGGYDSQINNEGEENLGYQRRPLRKIISYNRGHK